GAQRAAGRGALGGRDRRCGQLAGCGHVRRATQRIRPITRTTGCGDVRPMSALAEPTTAAAAESSAGGDDALHTTIGAYAWFEGRYVPIAQANVSIATHAFNYGTAVFEGIRAYRQHDGNLAILFAVEHYRRMLRNGRLLRANVPQTAEQLV